MTVEFEITRGIKEIELKSRTFAPEKDRPVATRVNPSNIEVVYPFIDKLISTQNEENQNPLIVIPTKSKEQDLLGIHSSFQGTSLHTAQMLALVFSRHPSTTRVDELKQYFPTFPENGLEIMSYFANRATVKYSGAERLFQIYKMYHEAQKYFFTDGLRLSKADITRAWDDKQTISRVRQFMGTIYYLYNTGQLMVSDPKTIMQFEVSLIPLFKDLMIQCPMSIDMIVKPPKEVPKIYDLKKRIPNIYSEESIHQRFIMEVATREYSHYLAHDSEPPYFGSPVIQSYIDAAPSEFGSLSFTYTTDRFSRTNGCFQHVNADIEPESQHLVYKEVRFRALQINAYKPLVRKLLQIHKSVAPYENVPSVFHMKTEKDNLDGLV